ncbi:hypothetical protein H2198_008151 [Neophaeococcomyces mojaviensis]|uniref:Uncharacterized protein n=1 Tax=Neophaeococcomyces mojaviensis TaxID=3383035 RepID=A0ACC2ZYA1_9EURO|nr:hypothetical protein H2198_008151 [Knufia sp. JES_112]
MFSTAGVPHMPTTPEDPQQFDEIASMYSGHVQDITAQDSGLGITTDENIYTAFQHTTYAEDSTFLTDEKNEHASQLLSAPKLASPFEHISRTPAVGWNGAYFCGTPNTNGNTTQLSPSDQSVLLPHNESISHQYIMSPAYYNSNGIMYGLQQQEQFKRPMIRHNSTSSTLPPLPQDTMYSYNTPAIEASPFQWTPSSATPDWHEANDFGSLSQMPTIRLDYSACNSVEQSPQVSQPQQAVRSVMTIPPMRKPRLRPSLSESCVPRMSSPARMRAASMGYYLQPQQNDQNASNTYVPQLPLPLFPPSMLIHHPQPQMLAPILPGTPLQRHRVNRSHSSAPQRRTRPSSPPPSDFVRTNTPYLTPVRQEPTFAGDLYTPRYKRRTPNGRWEGWCGYCQPGRWLDLKNSRFWEDKLRNHGICAKTKMRFAEPERIRWVSSDGTVLPENIVNLDGAESYLDTRKREGLCGVCQTWIVMDGLRTKARDRAVGWWMHAYKVR